jgi:UDP-glucuronate 4-epimerase
MFRDFTYIDDIVSGIKASIGYDTSKPMVFNLGNNKCERLMDVVSIIEDCLGKKAEKELLPMQMGDVPKSHANIDLARKLLNYNPTTNIDVGVRNFIDWYKEYKY